MIAVGLTLWGALAFVLALLVFDLTWYQSLMVAWCVVLALAAFAMRAD